MTRWTRAVITGTAISTSAPASHAPMTSVTQWVSTTMVPSPTTAAPVAASTQATRRPAGGTSMATIPNITTAFDACPDGKIVPPASTSCAWVVTLGPNRPVPYLTAATLRLRASSATANIVTGCQFRVRQARQAT
jgi:hypothetical protein